MKMLRDVHEFFEKFNLPQRKPGQPFDREIVLFRVSCLIEELHELTLALNNDDFAKSADALVDLAYFTVGTAHILNLPFEQAWNEVHAANLRKVRLTSSRQSKRGSILDIGKPKGWPGPDIEQFLHPEDQRTQAQARGGEQLDIETFIKSQG